MTERDCRGQLLPMAVIALVLLVFASAPPSLTSPWPVGGPRCEWTPTPRQPTFSPAPPTSSTRLLFVTARSRPAPGSAPVWQSLPDRDGCAGTVLEGCWTAAFTTGVERVTVPGREATRTPVELPVWTVTVAAAARCDQNRMPTSVADAREICEAVTSDTVLTYEIAAPPPVYPTLLHSGRLWPDEPDVPPVTACDDGATPPAHGAAVWCAIPELSRPPITAYDDPDNRMQVEADHIAGAGLFVNTEGRGLVLADCPGGACEAANPNEHRTLAHGTEDLALPEGACTADPAVWDWAESGHTEATRARGEWESRWNSELASFVAALAGSWSVSDVRTEWANTVSVASLDDVADADIQAVITPTPSTADEGRAAAEALAGLAGGTAPRDPGTLLEADETVELTLSDPPGRGDGRRQRQHPHHRQHHRPRR